MELNRDGLVLRVNAIKITFKNYQVHLTLSMIVFDGDITAEGVAVNPGTVGHPTEDTLK